MLWHEFQFSWWKRIYSRQLHFRTCILGEKNTNLVIQKATREIYFLWVLQKLDRIQTWEALATKSGRFIYCFHGKLIIFRNVLSGNEVQNYVFYLFRKNQKMLAIRFHQKSDILKEKVQKKCNFIKNFILFWSSLTKTYAGKRGKIINNKTEKTFELISGAKIVHSDGFTGHF